MTGTPFCIFAMEAYWQCWFVAKTVGLINNSAPYAIVKKERLRYNKRKEKSTDIPSEKKGEEFL